jgi:hypothetical protein
MVKGVIWRAAYIVDRRDARHRLLIWQNYLFGTCRKNIAGIYMEERDATRLEISMTNELQYLLLLSSLYRQRGVDSEEVLQTT